MFGSAFRGAEADESVLLSMSTIEGPRSAFLSAIGPGHGRSSLAGRAAQRPCVGLGEKRSPEPTVHEIKGPSIPEALKTNLQRFERREKKN